MRQGATFNEARATVTIQSIIDMASSADVYLDVFDIMWATVVVDRQARPRSGPGGATGYSPADSGLQSPSPLSFQPRSPTSTPQSITPRPSSPTSPPMSPPPRPSTPSSRPSSPTYSILNGSEEDL